LFGKPALVGPIETRIQAEFLANNAGKKASAKEAAAIRGL